MSNQLLGYRIQEEIYTSKNARVYRAARLTDNTPVILKTPHESNPSAEQVAQFEREFQLNQSLNIDGLVRVYELAYNDHQPVIAVEDFGAQSLAALYRGQAMPLDVFWPLAVRVVHILSDLHRQHVIHKDLNPANILYNPQAGTVKITDLGIASRLSRETPTLANANMLEGTLPYLAPEQTGRMNRDVDYRADFYALGATFYELLTGQPPFTYQTPEELVHAHLAETAVPPHEIRLDLPRTLSDMIMRLLAKNAEERYQLAYGLQADLVECWSRWTVSKHIEPFELGQYDTSDQFQLPQGLYGRTAEIGLLQEMFARVNQGHMELLFLGGYAGIGKSALVGELHRPVSTTQGHFVQSKFDQYSRSEPYAPVIQALRGLIRPLLSTADEVLAVWRERFTAAFDPDTAVLTALIPELRPIVGDPPPAASLPPTEAQRRLQTLLVQLINLFTAEKRPLIIFLDDSQWADSTSLSLLGELLTAVEPHYLFFITAYRDHEVGPTHPLVHLRTQLQQADRPARQITLEPLPPTSVTRYIADTLHRPPTDVQALSTLVYQKTGGNPFFLGLFLHNLYTAGHLSFDPHSTHWVWDLATIEAQGHTDNVIRLLAEQVSDLPTSTQRIIKLAACIGSQFDLALLSRIAEQEYQTTARQLWPALQTDLIQPLDNTYRLLDSAASAAAVSHLNVRFRFVHDRIQQAAYDMIDEAERAPLHWRIGQLLQRDWSPEASADAPEQLFTLVNHLNEGRTECRTAEEQWQLLQLNFQAGRRARAATAFVVAYEYLHTAVSLLPDAHLSPTQTNLRRRIYNAAVEAAFLTSHYEQMHAWAEAALPLLDSAVDRTPIYDILLQAAFIQREYQAATDLGLAALRDLGVNISPRATADEVAAEMAAVRTLWQEKDILSLANRPAPSDPHIISRMLLLHRLNSPMPFVYPVAYPLVALAQVRLSLEQGTTRYSANAFVVYAVTLLADQRDIEAGYQFARLALTVVRKHNAREFEAHVNFAFNALIRFWREPLERTLDALLGVYTTGLETGDYLHGPLGALVHFLHAFWHGRELGSIEAGLETYQGELVRLKSAYFTPRYQLYRQVMRALQGKTAGLTSFSSPPSTDDPMGDPDEAPYDEEAVLASFEARQDQTSIASFQIFKLLLHYLYGEYEAADDAATAVAERLPYLKSGYWIIAYNALHALTLLAQCLDSPPDDPDCVAKLARVEAHQKQLATWMRFAPHNIEPYWQLVEAELCRLRNKLGQARLHYEKAVTLARHSGYMNLRALAQERAGLFFLAEGHEWLARFFLSEAHYAYLRWGADAKADWLRSSYPNIVVHSTAQEDVTTTRIRATISHSTSRGVVSTALDLSAITRASQAIAAEVMPDKLQSKMMQVVLENAGAQRGLLLMPHSSVTSSPSNGREGWHIQVEGLKTGSHIETKSDVTSLTPEQAPLALVNYVIRTQDSIVLHNALRDDPTLAQDPYVQATRLRSALCLPLMNRGRLVGVLYLENNLASGAFTDDHLGMLHILASQTAVSLDNARLYEGLENMVAERTQELEEAVAELDAFAHTVAHDLKAPLSGLLGYADMLREAYDELDEAERNDIFERLIRGGIHMRDIIDALLLLAQTRHDAVKTEVIDMATVVDEVLHRFDYFMREKEAQITQPEPEGWPQVIGYAPWVAEVWANYLSNALKYGGLPPRVELGFAREPTDDTASDVPQATPYMRFWVRDHGRGMTPEQRAQVFAPFVKVGQRQADSHGLGLSIAQRIVERLGGQVGVESEIGQGSTFWFTLPTPALS